MKLIVELAGSSRRLAKSKMWQKLDGTFRFEFDMSVKVVGCRGVLSGVDDAPMPISISQRRRCLSRPRMNDQVLIMYTSSKKQRQRYPTSWPCCSTTKLSQPLIPPSNLHPLFLLFVRTIGLIMGFSGSNQSRELPPPLLPDTDDMNRMPLDQSFSSVVT